MGLADEIATALIFILAVLFGIKYMFFDGGVESLIWFWGFILAGKLDLIAER